MRSPNHQPGEAEFRSVLPEDIIWKPYPGFPPGVHNAAVVGDPTKPGPYTIRVKVPAGVKLMPHKHPEDRVYTLSPVFSTLAWVIGSTPRSFKLIRPAVSSFCRAIPPIFTGQDPASMSAK